MALSPNVITNRSKSKVNSTSNLEKVNKISKLSKANNKSLLHIQEKILKEKKLPFPKSVCAIAGKKLHDSCIFWVILAIVRIYLSIAQTGYIHPDEFHQSLQVNAYDILNIDGEKPWEYSSESPIRSAMFTGLLSFPYFVLKLVAPYIKWAFDIDVITPRVLLILPRVFMTFLSFISDYCVYKIASCCYTRPWQCVEVFAGSYIMLVYASRTFSNSIELILFSVLLWRVCLSMVDSTKIIRLENVLKDLYESADSLKDKVKIARKKNHLPSYNFGNSFFISLIVAYGFFVRPTFIIYAFVPVAFWLQRGIVTREIDFMYFNLRCASLLPGIILTFVTCILVDSFYYNSITLSELIFGNVTANSFTVTPLNFILYNSKDNNLGEHGFHPYLLHIGVNIPMLHGVLGIYGMWSFSKYLTSLIFRKMSCKPKVYSIATMLLASFVFPVFALSLIPHQEPRFLLPTLTPLILLHSDKISIYALPKFKFTKHFCFLMWQVWNILCVVFFGFLHQGGVTKTMMYIHDYVSSQPPTYEYQVFFSHMYTPPTFLLMRKIPVLVSEDGHKYRVRRTINTHDLGSSLSMSEIYDKLKIDDKDSERLKVLLCISASLSIELEKSLPQNTTLEKLARLPGHFSAEHLPPFHLSHSLATLECDHSCQIARRIKEFSIDIFHVNFGSYHTPTKIDDNTEFSENVSQDKNESYIGKSLNEGNINDDHMEF